jgi:hypothetical protein
MLAGPYSRGWNSAGTGCAEARLGDREAVAPRLEILHGVELAAFGRAVDGVDLPVSYAAGSRQTRWRSGRGLPRSRNARITSASARERSTSSLGSLTPLGWWVRATSPTRPVCAAPDDAVWSSNLDDGNTTHARTAATFLGRSAHAGVSAPARRSDQLGRLRGASASAAVESDCPLGGARAPPPNASGASRHASRVAPRRGFEAACLPRLLRAVYRQPGTATDATRVASDRHDRSSIGWAMAMSCPSGSWTPNSRKPLGAL